MFIKVDGTWHQANAAETATICGLDPDEAQDYRPTLPEGATLHDGCAHIGEAGPERQMTAYARWPEVVTDTRWQPDAGIPDAESGSHLLDEPKPGGDMWPGTGGYVKPEAEA